MNVVFYLNKLRGNMSDNWLPKGDHQKNWGLTIHHIRHEDAGDFVGGGHKICWHTTEGGTLGSVLETLKEKRAGVHFVIDPRTGQVYQCIPLNKAGRGLEHNSGPETNRANVIQVEIVGFAKDAAKWPNDYYKRLANLFVLITHRFPIPNRNAARCSFSNPKKIGNFVSASGHCGHVHVPGNSHWDPGTGFKGDLLKRYIIRKINS